MKGGFMLSTLDKIAIGLCLGFSLWFQIYISVQITKIIKKLENIVHKDEN